MTNPTREEIDTVRTAHNDFQHSVEEMITLYGLPWTWDDIEFFQEHYGPRYLVTRGSDGLVYVDVADEKAA